jgi:cytochrome c oxidase subunit 2
MWTRRLLAIFTFAGCASSCGGPQSALDAAGRDAAHIANLFTVMTVGALLVWTAVVAIAIYTIRVREPHSERAASLLIVGGGVTAPTVVLGALIAYGMPLVPTILTPGTDAGLVVHVTAKQWWWRMEYETPAGRIETANDLRLPVGARVELRLISPDVIHSFWVPSLAGKMDMIPGRVTRLALEPTRPGTFRGACAEYCGASHALMAFSVTVMPRAEFQTWLEAQGRAAAAPTTEGAVVGQAAFVANGCGACHTIRGTSAVARIGPDLTHVGSRARIAAETLPNQRAALIRWITLSDRVKPGVHMPPFRALPDDQLTALAAYLESLQ